MNYLEIIGDNFLNNVAINLDEIKEGSNNDR